MPGNLERQGRPQRLTAGKRAGESGPEQFSRPKPEDVVSSVLGLKPCACVCMLKHGFTIAKLKILRHLRKASKRCLESELSRHRVLRGSRGGALSGF